jgi:hypothetical protein
MMRFQQPHFQSKWHEYAKPKKRKYIKIDVNTTQSTYRKKESF